MRTQATLQKWGNSVALRLSGNLKTIPNFEVGDTVDIDISEQGLVIQKVVKKPLTEESLLAGLTAYTAHADERVDPTEREFDY
ncbi:AbrB/MazE/SpoVT family DNA-binding domain-containing protein [Yersinia mollaretii]|uniref:AbrB/MazE/SpoVT family DNA-binding domain-containing protein n=1 Tax=Yersinia mollaretii TaxID=33060 RepID=UPI00005F81E7|nr:cell growth regulatory protein MazE [Yersinia mollaretii]MDN0109073.1 transcriptional regulator [Yersinia mollaretii]PJE89025.1 transcriptional regulator [Yersinia mollaretii]QKJ04860.1 transcriptional regulator [Yersinia mollaretii ATCC 43969]CQD40709.1 ChpR family protein [Yersinia mollaretii]CQH16830.1 ChpR family protein [Yersinia mollaretii]